MTKDVVPGIVKKFLNVLTKKRYYFYKNRFDVKGI